MFGWLIIIVMMLGGFYGFALYIRDLTRAFRRLRKGGGWELWPPESSAPPRPDGGWRWG